jgi:anti-sigma B factor antagonist
MHLVPNLDIDIVERDDAVLVVLEGEVDLCAAPRLEESLLRAAASPAPAIVVDLDRVSFMDSAGAHVLVQFSLSEQGRGRLSLTPGPPQVSRLFDMTGVRRYLTFVGSPQLRAS